MFSVPLHSAVAARVYIEIRLAMSGETFPGSVVQQASWWATRYRNMSENSTIFSSIISNFERDNRKYAAENK